MSLAQILKNDFSSFIRDRGTQYYNNGWVKVVDAAPDLMTAEVAGSRTYSVEIKLRDNSLYLSCSCPFFDSSGPCKHLWASIVAADQSGSLADARPGVTALFETDDQDPEPIRRTAPAPTTITKARQPVVVMPPAQPRIDWRKQLKTVFDSKPYAYSSGDPWTTDRELHFALDIEASKTHSLAVIELLVRDRKQNGEWGKLKEPRISRREAADIPDVEDRSLVAELAGAMSVHDWSGSTATLSSSYKLSQPLAAKLLPRLAATDRFWIKRAKDRTSDTPVSWDPRPWLFEVAFEQDPSGYWALQGTFRRGEEALDIGAPELVVPGFLLFEGKLAPAEAEPFFWVSQLRKPHFTVIAPPTERDELIRQVMEHPYAPPLVLPKDLQFAEIGGKPTACVRIEVSNRAGSRQEKLTGTLAFEYGGQRVDPNSTTPRICDFERRQVLVRDLDAERTATSRLHEVGFRRRNASFYEPNPPWELTPSKLPAAVRTLTADGWHVEAHGKLVRKSAWTKLEITSGVDWFELHGEADYGGAAASLPELLAAARRGDGLVRLDDGSFGVLPEEWLHRFAPLARMGEEQEGHMRFGRAQAGLLDALLALEPETTFDETFAHFRDKMRSFQGIAPAPQPEGFQGQLREYQRDGVAWMGFLRDFGFGGCLADDMGVGKTAQVLAMLLERRLQRGSQKPSLVVVPRSLVFNWTQESGRFTPQLQVLDHTGMERDIKLFAGYDIVLTTYGTLRRDILSLKNVEFDYVILDEAQAVKNSSTDSAKAVRLLKAEHRLALSGTPVENHLGELWSLFEFLNPGMLGASAAFASAGHATRSLDEATRPLLAQALRPFILRRTKEQVARELPEKSEQVIYCELESEQRRLYNELRDHYRDALLHRIDRDGLAKSKMQVLEALLRLRQAACHPGLIDRQRRSDESAKLTVLMEQLREVLDEGHKALVFSQFTSLLDIVKGEIEEAKMTFEYLDGKTRDRQQRVDRFQNDPDCRLFLISLKAGGLGLNLTAADYVFLLDPWWNPAVEAQAIDRTHRIGQTRRVFAYRLIARDTVEEKVLELQETKRDLVEAIIGEDNSLIRNLKREDLELLLS
ncbi:MAG: DEAD/DEAH box helicase [Bryobacteraceae bacterium]